MDEVIETLRAEAAGLTAQAQAASEAAEAAVAAGRRSLAEYECAAAIFLVRMSEAKLAAAAIIEGRQADGR
jgi:alkylhydroperoxidase family enzyme